METGVGDGVGDGKEREGRTRDGLGWGEDVCVVPVDGVGGDVAGVGFMTRLFGC